eukprot:7643771-Lingulodinium_polyedra.AAC.1
MFSFGGVCIVPTLRLAFGKLSSRDIEHKEVRVRTLLRRRQKARLEEYASIILLLARWRGIA